MSEGVCYGVELLGGQPEHVVSHNDRILVAGKKMFVMVTNDYKNRKFRNIVKLFAASKGVKDSWKVNSPVKSTRGNRSFLSSKKKKVVNTEAYRSPVGQRKRITIQAVAWNKKRPQYLVSSGMTGNNNICLWDLSRNALLHAIEDATKKKNDIVQCPTKRGGKNRTSMMFGSVSGGVDVDLRCFSGGIFSKGIVTESFRTKNKQNVLKWFPHDRRAGCFLSGGKGKAILLWDIRTKTKPQLTLNSRGIIFTLDINKGQPNQVVAASQDGGLELWDLANPGKPLSSFSFKSHYQHVTTVKWHPKDRLKFCTSGKDSIVRIWSMGNPPVEYAKVNTVYGAKKGGVKKVVWRSKIGSKSGSDDCLKFATIGSYNDKFHIWDTDFQFVPKYEFSIHSHVLTDFTFVETGGKVGWGIVSCSKNGELCFLEKSVGERVRERKTEFRKSALSWNFSNRLACTYNKTPKVKKERPSRFVFSFMLRRPRRDNPQNSKIVKGQNFVKFIPEMDDFFSVKNFLYLAKNYRLLNLEKRKDIIALTCRYNSNIAKKSPEERNEIVKLWDLCEKVFTLEYIESFRRRRLSPTHVKKTPILNRVVAKNSEAFNTLNSPNTPKLKVKLLSAKSAEKFNKSTEDFEYDLEDEEENMDYDNFITTHTTTSKLFVDENESFLGDGSGEESDSFLEEIPISGNDSIDVFEKDCQGGERDLIFENDEKLIELKKKNLQHQLFKDVIRDTILEMAEDGDIQTGVVVCTVIGPSLVGIDKIQYYQWVSSYIDMLNRNRLYHLSAKILKYLKSTRFRNISKKDALVNIICGNCERKINPGDSVCQNCKHRFSKCVVCELPVKTSFFMCSYCLFGGHKTCLTKFINKYGTCPRCLKK